MTHREACPFCKSIGPWIAKLREPLTVENRTALLEWLIEQRAYCEAECRTTSLFQMVFGKEGPT